MAPASSHSVKVVGPAPPHRQVNVSPSLTLFTDILLSLGRCDSIYTIQFRAALVEDYQPAWTVYLHQLYYKRVK